MRIEKLMTDEAILIELGRRLVERRLVERRLALALTQAELAEQAGISKRTIERVEAGSSAQFSTWIRILKIVDLLDGLEMLVPEEGPRPIDLLKLESKKRKRASRKKKVIWRGFVDVG